MVTVTFFFFAPFRVQFINSVKVLKSLCALFAPARWLGYRVPQTT